MCLKKMLWFLETGHELVSRSRRGWKYDGQKIIILLLPCDAFGGCQVEDFLSDYLDDSFATYAEDGSPGQVISHVDTRLELVYPSVKVAKLFSMGYGIVW